MNRMELQREFDALLQCHSLMLDECRALVERDASGLGRYFGECDSLSARQQLWEHGDGYTLRGLPRDISALDNADALVLVAWSFPFWAGVRYSIDSCRSHPLTIGPIRRGWRTPSKFPGSDLPFTSWCGNKTVPFTVNQFHTPGAIETFFAGTLPTFTDYVRMRQPRPPGFFIFVGIRSSRREANAHLDWSPTGFAG